MNVELIVLFFAFGLLFGSLAGMCAYRIPRELPLGLFKQTRSFCPGCKKQIAFYDNIPVLSWLLLGGRCRKCKRNISIRYPLIELATACAFVFVAWVWHFGFDFTWQQNVHFLFDLYFFWTLVVLTFVDLEFRIIPDRFSIGNWILAIILAIIVHFTEGASLWLLLGGGAAGFGSFYLIGFAYEKLKGIEGLGFGDVKMLGWLGTWLGILDLPILILTSAIGGLIVGVIVMLKGKDGLKTAIPFGPFLALGAVIVWTLQKMQLLPFDLSILSP